MGTIAKPGWQKIDYHRDKRGVLYNTKCLIYQEDITVLNFLYIKQHNLKPCKAKTVGDGTQKTER